MLKKALIFGSIIFVLVLTACVKGNDEEASEAIDRSGETYYSVFDRVRARIEPDPELDAIAFLAEGEAVTYLGETTEFTATYTLRGKEITAPWMKVQLSDGTVGWVFGGALAGVIEPSADIRTVAETGDLGMVIQIVDNGEDVDAIDDDGYTLLHNASINGHLDIVKYLISAGADVNAIDIYNYTTPLDVASENGYLDVVKYLVSAGADVNKMGEAGASLFWASGAGHLNVAKYLVSAGAEVNAATYDGWTPLHEASMNGNLDVVKYLISVGAEVNAKDDSGNTPMDVASKYDYLDIAKYLRSVGEK